MKPPAGTPQTLRLAPAPSPVSATVSKAKLTTYKSQSVSDMPSMVGKGQMSMEALRQTYDAVVIGTITSPACPTDEENLKLGQSAFPCLGRFLLCLVGHLQFGTGLPSWLFSFFSFAVLPISLTGLLVCATVVISGASTNWSMTMVLTLSFFQLGVSFASVAWCDACRRNQPKSIEMKGTMVSLCTQLFCFIRIMMYNVVWLYIAFILLAWRGLGVQTCRVSVRFGHFSRNN